MSYLIDTCVISELTQIRPFPAVINWLADKREQNLYLSVITIAELHRGIAKLTKSKKQRRLSDWINRELMLRFHGRILPVDERIARVFGQIQADAEQRGRKMPAMDSFIAATAIVHELTVVTRNTKDIEQSGVDLCNPWLHS